MKIQFTIPGKPQPKQRPRMNRKTGSVYTPKETKDYANTVGTAALHAITDLTGWHKPVDAKGWDKSAQYRVELDVYLPDRRRRDVDNIAKAVLDGCNTIVFDDDWQVIELLVCKGLDRENPRVEMSVEVLPA